MTYQTQNCQKKILLAPINRVYAQPGFQENFLRSAADITIGGSGAGVGKTHASLLKPIYYIDNPEFGAVYFRRTFAQIKNIGALWDQSKKIYPLKNAKPNETDMSWKFPSGAVVKLSHLQHEKNIYDHQGAEYPLIIFDELTHFTETMFWYLTSRNRSTCGVRPKIMATCNPDPDSWVARLIEWWIDQETGYPIKERGGVVRYFFRENGNLAWGNTKQEVLEQIPHVLALFGPEVNPRDLVKSMTFIPGSIHDNRELLKVNPEYLSNLLAQDESVKAQLLDSNWKIRQDNTSLFDFKAINDVFSNYISDNRHSYITCDAARFGRDLCVAMVWKGWEVIHMEILKLSDVHDIVGIIEKLRKKFNVQKSHVLVDQDGVGAATVKSGDYRGFSGGAQPRKIQGLKENYQNLKTQCYYYLAEQKVNMGDIRIALNSDNCYVDGVPGTKIKQGAKVVDVTQLIREDLRAIKRDKIDMEGKHQINSKEEQKIILGRSPDFGDTLMMRALFDFVPKNIYL